MMLATMQLRAFVAVFESGTVTEAASRVGRTQPQTSRLVAELEQASGLVLFRREKRRLVPTEEGAAFYEEVARTLHGLDDLTRVASVLRRDRPEQFYILTMPNLAHTIVPDCISRMRKRFPRMIANVDIATRNQLGAVVGFRPFDIALAVLPSIDLPGMVMSPLGSVPTVALVPKSLPLAKQRLITLGDIAAVPFVATSRSTVLRVMLDELCAREQVALHLVAEAPNVLTAGRMAETGVGVAIVDGLTARYVDASAVAVRPWKPGLAFTLGLIEPKRARPNRIAPAFAEECRRTFHAHARHWKSL
jgi:DNA-binding transcriptional LysR family regulator